MYHIPYFKANDQKEVVNFMQWHPFVVLTGCDGGNRPMAAYVPVLLEEREEKYFPAALMMKQTDHQKAFLQNSHVLATFTRPHTYVSVSWYEDTKQTSTGMSSVI